MASKRMQWARRMQAWKRSGQTRVAFCRAHGLSPATFDYWRRLLRQPSRALVPVLVGGAAAMPVEIVLLNGLRLRMAATAVTQAGAWVEALRGC